MKRWRFLGLFLMGLHSGAGEEKISWAADDFVGETIFLWQLFTFPHQSSEVTVKLGHPKKTAKH